MPKILVTGANGFVGQHLVKELYDNGIEVIGTAHTRPIEKPSYIHKQLVIDLTKPGEVEKIDFKGISSIIHLAAITDVRHSFDDPLSYININLGIEINLFEAALKQRAKPKFLLISSGTFYKAKSTLPLTEESPVVPNSPYAASKICQEEIAKYYQTRGFDCIIARPFNHIGPGQGTGFIVPDLAKQIVEVEKGLKKNILVGNLDSKRDYTDVRDIVRAYRLLIEKGQSGEIYNICSGKALSGKQVLSGLLKQSTIKPEITLDPSKMRPSDTPISYGSHDKLTKDTKWQPQIPLNKTLADVMTYWRGRS
ncbi:MAG TPA: NAD-dependent epimerase/dehydratase family protein [Candidatus Saccharimonadales bacterium]|jgi:GDP-4-dehydro-6-deoxy-D-mannose reductase